MRNVASAKYLLSRRRLWGKLLETGTTREWEMREIWLMTKRWTTLSGKPEMGGGKVEAE